MLRRSSRGLSLAAKVHLRNDKHREDAVLYNRSVPAQSDERRAAMHFVISATYGPTDPTRAMLPFIFAATALQDGDKVTLMLFADSVFAGVAGVGAKLVPVGPPNKYEDVVAHPNATVLVCKPCLEARGLGPGSLDRRVGPGGMNDFHAAAKSPDARVINF
jgi:tRNA 2-thiouridine synthesizing protein D